MNWEKVNFSNVVKDITGGNVKFQTNEYNHVGSFPIIDQGSNEIAGFTEKKEFVKRTKDVVVFGDHTKCLKYVDFDFCLGADGVKVFEPIDKLDSKFLYFYLKTINLPDVGYSRHFKFLKEIQIPLPPLPTQKRIAEILDAADALRRKDQALLKKYDELAQAIFIDMFGDPVKNEKGWEVKKLEDFTKKQKGDIRTGPFGSQLLIEELLDEGIPVYGIDNVQSKGFVWAKSKHISIDKFKELNGFKIKKGDVLVTRTGTVGRSCVAPDEIPDSIIGPNLLRVSLNHTALLPDIFSFLLNNFQSIKEKIKSLSPGATVAVFNSGNLKELEICALPIDLQLIFLQQLNFLKLQKSLVEKNNSESLFNSLIQKAFMGELVA